ncbi:MAG: hypothetical protein JWN29_647 [Acidimicrobiales bacterium]|nr:hypothetical protein [Acidimicrobiales bacterium]
MTRRRDEAGQAAVELALCLPLVAALALALLQVTLVVRDQVLLTHAAREAAREAAVSADAAAVRRAATSGARLDPGRLDIEVRGRGAPGSRVTVVVGYRSPTAVPLVGALVGDVHLSSTATMRVET